MGGSTLIALLCFALGGWDRVLRCEGEGEKASKLTPFENGWEKSVRVGPKGGVGGVWAPNV